MSLTLAYFNFLLKRSESERLLANVMLRVEKELFRVKIAVKRREAKRSKKQRRKGEIYPFDCRGPKNITER